MKSSVKTIFMVFGLLVLNGIANAGTVTIATGGDAIPSNTAPGCISAGNWTALTGPDYAEEGTAEVKIGTIILNVPTGFEFDTGGTAPTVLITRTFGNGNDKNNINNVASGTSVATARTASTLTLTVTGATSNGVWNSLTWQNIRIRPTASAPLASGNITKTGTATMNGVAGTTNFGTLTEVASAPTCNATIVPTVTTNNATVISATGATLNGTVSSNGASTAVTFDYGLTVSYGNTATATASPLAANAINTAVSAAVTGFTCGTTYHFRIKGVNSVGTSNGNDLAFTTTACPAPIVTSINTASANPTTANITVGWTVVFDTAVTGVDLSDFSLVAAGGATGATLGSVSGSGTTYTVTANTGTGTVGTLTLKLVDNDSIVNASSTPLGGVGAGNGNFTGQSYTICSPPSNIPAGVSVSCQCDSFARATLNPSTIFGANWIVSTSDATGILPSIVNSGYLRLTNNTGNNAKAVTVPGIFPAAGNYISVEFRQYAYNGSGADGIAVTLSDYAVPAVPGAYGGSLGYAQETGIHDGFAGGWLGVGLDEYGNYQNATEGRLGGPGFTVESVGARGSGAVQAGYRWLGGTSSLSPKIDNNTSTTASLGYYYQVVVDARNDPASTAIAVNRDTGGGYAPLITIPNVYTAATAQGFTQAPVPANWQISFTGSTGGSTNIHEIGGLRICATTMVPTSGGTAGGFNAIDEAYGTPPLAVQNYLSGRIYTKLVGTSFKLNVAALTNSQLVTTYAASSSKTVTVKLVDNSDSLTDTTKDCTLSCTSTCTGKAAVTGGAQTLTFASGSPDKGQKQSSSFTINSAYQKLVAIISDGTTTACSIDSFAVRPLSIASVISSDATNTTTSGAPILKAGSDKFSMTATTTGVGGSPSGYNGVMKINNASVQAASPATVTGAVAGTFPEATPATPSSAATGSTFTYSEVGGFKLPGFDPATDTTTRRSVYDGVATADECTTPGLTTAQCDVLRVATWTGVDSISTKGDCVADSYSNTKDVSGKYGCNFGLLPNAVVFGRFVPDHFDTVVKYDTGSKVFMACPSGLTCPVSGDLGNGFVYSGQPFTTQVTALNAAGIITLNYDTAKTLSKDVTLSACVAPGGVITNPGVGGLTPTPNAIPASAFNAGVALISNTPAFTFTTTSTAPTDIFIRAIDTDNISSLRAASVEGGLKIVSGRIKVSNAYGSELLPLPLTATVQFFNTAGSWVPSSSDTVTSIAAANFALAFPVATANKLAACETALSVAGSSPNFRINMSMPGTDNNGWSDLTLNLGAIATGNRCTAVGGMGALSTTSNQPWLQYPAGSNPTGRATFGVYKGRNDFIYQRESY